MATRTPTGVTAGAPAAAAARILHVRWNQIPGRAAARPRQAAPLPPPPPLLPPPLRACRRRLLPAHAAVQAAGGASDTPEESESQLQPREAEVAGIEAEILSVALPTLATLAADPLASLVSTWYVGLLGTQPLASAGVALSLFNSATKLLNMPLLAVTTSSVAQALGKEQVDKKDADRGRHAALGAAVSAALTLALVTGTAQAVLLGAFGTRWLAVWGASPGGPLYADAAAYLSARVLFAPATVLMLVLQGCFRGLGDTRVPFYATVLANALNLGLEPLLIFVLGWGVRGAALAVGLSQAAACAVLLAMLHRRCPLQLAGRQSLGRSLGYLRSTGLLALRTLAIMGVYSLATSLAARTDPAHTAGHQIAFQVWLASSLLADSLAVAAQTLLARSLAAGRRQAGRQVVARTLRMALALGCLLAAGLAVGRGNIAQAFSRDPAVLCVLGLLMPVVILTQPINSLAFLMDGILYGVNGFKFAAAAMVAACLPAGAVMLWGAQLLQSFSKGAVAPPDARLLAVWAGLGLLMLLRFLTIYWPLQRGAGPFSQLEGL